MVNRVEQRQIDALDDIVRESYRETRRNVEYSLGELDYIGLRFDGYWDIYEVKTTDNGIKKARLQLTRAYNFCYDLTIKDCFIYVASEDWLSQYIPPIERRSKKYSRQRRHRHN